MLVGGVGHIAFAAFEDDGHDLAAEVTGLGGALRAVVAFDGQRVLLVAADAPFGGDIFCRHTHVDILEGVVQRADHHVGHFGVAHACAPAHIEGGKGRAAHVLCTAADGDVGIA